MGEVLRFVEGPQQGKGRARRKADTPFADLWQQVDRAISDILDNTTFARPAARLDREAEPLRTELGDLS